VSQDHGDMSVDLVVFYRLKVVARCLRTMIISALNLWFVWTKGGIKVSQDHDDMNVDLVVCKDSRWRQGVSRQNGMISHQHRLDKEL
jgi:hypothetical protein